MGANRYSCGISLGAIRATLMAKSSHNMGIFLQFLASLVIVLGVVTTVMNALGIERTQTLTCGAVVLGHFCPLVVPIWPGSGPKMGILGVKIRPLWQAFSRVRI